jgi:phage shock protein PspC (stress-responsive transcriptional regulator)
MQKVVTINLNGHAYQLDEAAYDAVRAYLQQAETRLKDNPDRVEILADLERAIAEKCARFLGPHKTVVGAAEMDQVVAEMGPVEGTDSRADGTTAGAAAAGTQPAGRSTPKRLYRIRDGQMIAGVCSGLAAYLNVDVTLVRVVFLILAWIGGVGVLAYIALTIVIPYADTPEEQAAASGQPFNAQELIDSIKRHATDFKDHGKWKHEWRQQSRRWRAEQRAWRQQFRHTMRQQRWWGPMPAPPIGSSRAYLWTGLLLPIFSLINLAFFALLAFSILSLVNTGGLYGWPLPDDVPLWAGILILVVLYQVATSPFRAARQASHYAWGHYYGWFAMWDGLIATGATILLIWLLFTHMPPVDNLREFVQNLPEAFRALGRDVSMWFKDLAESAR